MKKRLAAVSLPLALVCMFACKKDGEPTPQKSGQDSTKTPVDTVKTPVDTAISGIYFRVHYDDTTIVYKPQAEVQTVQMISTVFMADNVAGHMFTFRFAEIPTDTGMYKTKASFGTGNQYVNDTLPVHVTKLGKPGESMEASFNGVLSNYEDATQTKTFKGDLRVAL